MLVGRIRNTAVMLVGRYSVASNVTKKTLDPVWNFFAELPVMQVELKSTICPRGLDPIYEITNYIKLVNNSFIM